MEVSEELMLTWGSHQLTLVNEVAQLRHQGCFADVTLACEGRLYLAHKFILAMCSDYFRNIFGPSGVGSSNSSLVVVLKDVACQDVEHLLDYMYTGVVAVEKSGLHSLIKTAENLQIKGLAFSDTPDPAPSPQRPDALAFGGGAGRQEEVITDDNSPANTRRINTMGPDVRLNRSGSNASRVPVNSREGISPPSKRKRLLESVGQTISSNSSNTSTTFSNNVRTSCSVSQQQMYSSKRRVSSPGGPPCSSSSPTGVPAMPHFTEPQSPVLPPASPQQFRQAGGSVGSSAPSLASKSFKDSPERPIGGSSEHHPMSSCSVPTVVTSTSQAISMIVGHSPKGGSCTEGAGEVEVAGGALQRPETLEIKKEEPDGEAATGVTTEVHLAVEGGPSNEASELKEEPPPEEGESGPSGLPPGLECWGAAGAEGGLLADAADEDEISDTDATGDEDTSKRLPPGEEEPGPRSPLSTVCANLKTEPHEDSPALFSMPATPVADVISALTKTEEALSAAMVEVSSSLELESDDNCKKILAVCSSAPASSVVVSGPPTTEALVKSEPVAVDCKPSCSLPVPDCTAVTNAPSTKVPHTKTSPLANATHSNDKPEFTEKLCKNIDPVEELLDSAHAARSGLRKGIGKSIFEVASPVANSEESEQSGAMSVGLYSIANDTASSVASVVPETAPNFLGTISSGLGCPSAVSETFHSATISVTNASSCQSTSNVELIVSSTKPKTVSISNLKSSTSLVFSSSTIPSLLGTFNEPTSNSKLLKEHCNPEEEVLSSNDTDLPVSSVSESTRSNISERNSQNVRFSSVDDHQKIAPSTEASVYDRPTADFDNPPSEASTVIFELKSVPMSIDSESSPENPDGEDVVEPLCVANPSDFLHCEDEPISDSSQVRDVSEVQLSEARCQTPDGRYFNEGQPHSGSRNSTSTVRCTQCPYTAASIAQLKSHARELHPDYFSQSMRSFQASPARTDHVSPSERGANVSNSHQHGIRPSHNSNTQHRVEVNTEPRNNPPSVPFGPSLNPMQRASHEVPAPPLRPPFDPQSIQGERYCNQAETGSQRSTGRVPLTVNISLTGSEGAVSQNYPSIPVSRLNPGAPHGLLLRAPQLPSHQRMSSNQAPDFRPPHDARDYSSSHGWHLASRNPNQPPQVAGRFPAPPFSPQISPHSSHRPQFPNQFNQPRYGPPQQGPNRNIAPTTTYSASATSTVQSELDRPNNYARMMNPPAFSTAPSAPAAPVPSQPFGSMHPMASANPNRFAVANAGVRMSLPSPVHSSHSVSNNLRVQPVRVGIFPRCNEEDLETVRQMAYPSVSGTQSLACFQPTLNFADFSQPPQPQPFLIRSPSETARLTIQPESEKKFTCPYCYMTLFGRQTLFDHVAMHANNDRSTYRKSWCPYCTLKCVSQQQLVAHFKSHTAEEIG